MNCSPETIEHLQKDPRDPPQWTQYACHVLSKTDSAVTLTLPFFALEKRPKVSQDQLNALLAVNKQRLAGATNALPKPGELPRQQGNAVRSDGALGGDLPAARPDQASTASNDPHTGDHAEPADRWGEK